MPPILLALACPVEGGVRPVTRTGPLALLEEQAFAVPRAIPLLRRLGCRPLPLATFTRPAFARAPEHRVTAARLRPPTRTTRQTAPAVPLLWHLIVAPCDVPPEDADELVVCGKPAPGAHDVDQDEPPAERA